MDKQTFGQFIADVRKSKTMTQKELADKLHITNTAVSKWERGLSYPDLELLEGLADALDLTTTELMSCRREAFGGDNEGVESLFTIAKETNKNLKRRFALVISVLCVAVVAMLCAVYLLFFRMEHAEGYVCFWNKQSSSNGSYLYVEKGNRLVTLRCTDPEIFESIIADNNCEYYVSYRWNPRTYRGAVLEFQNEPDDVLGNNGSVKGSIIGIDTLFDIDYIWQECTDAYEDPGRKNGYLYSNRYYYCGDGEDYYLGEKLPETTVLLVEDCRGTATFDYDDDGIVELFVLTKYDEAPYLLYDMENGTITSAIVEEIPQEVQENFQRNICY